MLKCYFISGHFFANPSRSFREGSNAHIIWLDSIFRSPRVLFVGTLKSRSQTPARWAVVWAGNASRPTKHWWKSPKSSSGRWNFLEIIARISSVIFSGWSPFRTIIAMTKTTPRGVVVSLWNIRTKRIPCRHPGFLSLFFVRFNFFPLLVLYIVYMYMVKPR